MMSSDTKNAQRGFVLIMALWSLGLLTVLAVAIGLGTRQKIVFLGRLEDRCQVQLAAEAGVKKAAAVLLDDLEVNQYLYSPQAKARRHNNAQDFGSIVLAGKKAEVVHTFFDEKSGVLSERHGICDERSKLNINEVDQATLTRLISVVLGYDSESARALANSIIDWRDYGRREAVGFFSDDYYRNLEFPYEMKELPFERIDELLLVKGMNLNVYEQLRPFVTLYGDGRVNINTVSKKVLLALGLDEGVIDKLLKARRGADDVDSTLDDHIFLKTFDIAVEVKSFVLLEEKEMRQIDLLNDANLLVTDSLVYSFRSRVFSGERDFSRSIDVIFDASQNKYLYWYEK
jgi:general secretion pathway protein K